MSSRSTGWTGGRTGVSGIGLGTYEENSAETSPRAYDRYPELGETTPSDSQWGDSLTATCSDSPVRENTWAKVHGGVQEEQQTQDQAAELQNHKREERKLQRYRSQDSLMMSIARVIIF